MEVYHENEEREPKNEAQYIARATVMLGGFAVVVLAVIIIAAKIAQCIINKYL